MRPIVAILALAAVSPAIATSSTTASSPLGLGNLDCKKEDNFKSKNGTSTFITDYSEPDCIDAKGRWVHVKDVKECAIFTATSINPCYFTMKTSEGPCRFVNRQLFCAQGVKQTPFASDGNLVLQYASSNGGYPFLYAKNVPLPEYGPQVLSLDSNETGGRHHRPHTPAVQFQWDGK